MFIYRILISLLLLFILSSGIYCYDQGGAYPDFAINNGFAYINDGINLLCVDINNKILKWKYKPLIHQSIPDELSSFNTTGISNFCYGNGKIFLGTYEGYLICLNSSDGTMIWEYKINNRITTKPIFKDNMVFYASDGYTVHCFDINKKSVVWTYSVSSEITNILVEENVFITCVDKYFYGVDLLTGKYKWKTLDSRSPLRTRPVQYNGHIYLGAIDGTVYNVDPDNGGIYWKTVGSDNFSEDIYPLIINNHIIYKHIKEALASFDIKKLEPLYRFDGDNIIPKTAIARDSMLYYAGDTKLYIANAVSGYYSDPINLGTNPISAPIIENNQYYNIDGNIFYSLNLESRNIEKIFEYSEIIVQSERVIPLNRENLIKIIRNISYPQEAIDKDIQGIVKIRCLIDKEGKIISKFISHSDHRLLEESALSALEKSSFSPIRAGDIYYQGWVEAKIPYKLKTKSE